MRNAWLVDLKNRIKSLNHQFQLEARNRDKEGSEAETLRKGNDSKPVSPTGGGTGTIAIGVKAGASGGGLGSSAGPTSGGGTTKGYLCKKGEVVKSW